VVIESETKLFNDAYILFHPARMIITRFLKKEGKSPTSRITKALGLSARLISFHISILQTSGFVESEYDLDSTSGSQRVARYYWITPKVDEIIREFIATLK
jgi:DNA-binding transcriptional ArsR family regulator